MTLCHVQGESLSLLQSQKPIYVADEGSFAAGEPLSPLQSQRPIFSLYRSRRASLTYLSLLCRRVAPLASTDWAARLALSLSLHLLNRTSLCSAVSEAWFAASRSLLRRRLSSFLSSNSSTRTDSLGNGMVCLALDLRAQVTGQMLAS